MLDLSTFNLSKCNICCKKTRPKLYHLSIFGLQLEKATVCGILHQHPQIFSNTKFRPKRRILKFGISKDWNFKKLMSYLKSASWNWLTCKVSSKNKNNLNLGTKIPYLGIFGLQLYKTYYQIFNQYRRICETIKFDPK